MECNRHGPRSEIVYVAFMYSFISASFRIILSYPFLYPRYFAHIRVCLRGHSPSDTGTYTYGSRLTAHRLREGCARARVHAQKSSRTRFRRFVPVRPRGLCQSSVRIVGLATVLVTCAAIRIIYISLFFGPRGALEPSKRAL